MLSLIALFLVMRHLLPAMASLIVLAVGAALAWSLGLVKPIPPLGISSLTLAIPAWDLATLIGLGVPLYLVTMASQNPAGVRRAARLGLPSADPARARRDRRGLARHCLPSGRIRRTWRRSRPRFAPVQTPIPIRPSAGSPARSTPCGGA